MRCSTAAALLHGAENIPGCTVCPFCTAGNKVPFFLRGSADTDAACKISPAPLQQHRQRALNAVVNHAQKAGGQVRLTAAHRCFHRRAGHQHRRILIHLDGCPRGSHIQNLTNESFLSHAHHIGHMGLPPCRRPLPAARTPSTILPCFNGFSSIPNCCFLVFSYRIGAQRTTHGFLQRLFRRNATPRQKQHRRQHAVAAAQRLRLQRFLPLRIDKITARSSFIMRSNASCACRAVSA